MMARWAWILVTCITASPACCPLLDITMINPPAAKCKDEIDLNLTTNIYRNGIPVARDQGFRVVRPSESLTGHVQITSKTAIHLAKIEFMLQGESQREKERERLYPAPGV